MDRNMLSTEILPDKQVHDSNKRICVVSIDQPDSKANVMSRKFFDELNELLDNLKLDALNYLVDCVIFTSKKPTVFLG